MKINLGSTSIYSNHIDQGRYVYIQTRTESFTTRNVVFFRPCLVLHQKFFHPSHRIFEHMHETLNIDKK